MTALDLTGQRFGRLTVVRSLRTTGSGQIWEVRCDCGNTRKVRTGKLRSGEHKSCGCLRGERMRAHHAACRVLVTDGKKRCTKCKDRLPVGDFHKCAKTVSGLQTRCKKCAKEYERELKFGLTVAGAEALLERQGGGCAGCKETKNLHVDHDHKTGKVRGFLCGNCNRALGLLRDNTETMKRLIRYLTGENNELQ